MCAWMRVPLIVPMRGGKIRRFAPGVERLSLSPAAGQPVRPRPVNRAKIDMAVRRGRRLADGDMAVRLLLSFGHACAAERASPTENRRLVRPKRQWLRSSPASRSPFARAPPGRGLGLGAATAPFATSAGWRLAPTANDLPIGAP